MLNQERTEDPAEALRLALLGWQAELWTCLPAELDSFDAEKMTCVAQPTIKGKWRDKTGKITDVQLPQCLDVPVVFPSGGGYTLTFPMAEGDEGLIVFASRCIDAWWQSGGVQNQAEIRMHSLSDGFFIPGIRSIPRVLSDFSTTSVQLRADDGSAYVDISDEQMKLVHPTKVFVDSPTVHMTGDLEVEGEITAKSDGGGSVTLSQHQHGTGAPKPAGTNPPTGGT